MFKMTKKKIYIEKEKRKKEKHFSNIFKVISDIFIPHKQPECFTQHAFGTVITDSLRRRSDNTQ